MNCSTQFSTFWTFWKVYKRPKEYIFYIKNIMTSLFMSKPTNKKNFPKKTFKEVFSMHTVFGYIAIKQGELKMLRRASFDSLKSSVLVSVSIVYFNQPVMTSNSTNVSIFNFMLRDPFCN